jgi:AraC-like DNA-binding protein
MNSTQEEFLVIKPNVGILKKHIKFYYFHNSHDSNFKKDVVYHPHYLTTLNIYKGVTVDLDLKGRTYVPTKSSEFSSIYTINKTKSKEVRLRGLFNKIGIVFNPLGINHFINRPLSEIVTESISEFDYFGMSLDEIAKEVFDKENLIDKRISLDNFFLNKYSSISDDRIVNAVGEILDSEGSIKIKDLAQQLNISRETLLRIFKKHLCYSFEEFKSVVRFRRALEYYVENEVKPNLTNVAIENQYYDQSAFVKHFKKVTGLSPKKFFSSLHDIGNSGTYWTFDD